MESLTPEWLPNLHPLVVHFPIAILLLGALANLATFFIPSTWWDEAKNTTIFVVGTISAAVTYYTGTLAADTVFLPADAQSVLTEHSDWAEYLLWFFILYSALRLAFHWFDLFERRAVQVLAFVLLVPGLVMVFETAEYGGKLVYGYGAGTGQLNERPEPESSEEVGISESVVMSSFDQKGNGDWSWEITPAAISDLITHFRWVNGSVQELNPGVTSTEPVRLKLTTSESQNLFVTQNSYQDVQIDYYLNLNDLDGEIQLVHHLQNADTYDFVSLNDDGIIQQGRIENGNRTIFEEGTFDPDGSLFIRVVGDGTHFRGYVDRELKVHGHGDAPERGAVGLKLSGSWSVLISKIELTQL